MGVAGVAEIIGKIIKAIITDPKMAFPAWFWMFCRSLAMSKG